MARQVALRPLCADVAAREQAKIERSQAAQARERHCCFGCECVTAWITFARRQAPEATGHFQAQCTIKLNLDNWAHLREMAATGRPKSSAAASISRCSWSNEPPGRTQSAGGSLRGPQGRLLTVKRASGGPLSARAQRRACCACMQGPSSRNSHHASFTCHPLVPLQNRAPTSQAVHPEVHSLPSPPVVQARPHVSAAAPPQLLQRVRQGPKCLSKAARYVGGNPHAALKARLRPDLNAWKGAAVRAAVALHPAGVIMCRGVVGRLGGGSLEGGRLRQLGCKSDAFAT